MDETNDETQNMKLRIEPNQIINIPIYFTPKIQSGTKIKNLKIYIHGYRNQWGKPVKSTIKLEGTVSQRTFCDKNWANYSENLKHVANYYGKFW